MASLEARVAKAEAEHRERKDVEPFWERIVAARKRAGIPERIPYDDKPTEKINLAERLRLLGLQWAYAEKTKSEQNNGKS